MERSYDAAIDFPTVDPDEREQLLRWLRFLRGAIIRNLDGVSDEDSRWTPDGKLISLLGIINHLTNVEWRWIDGHLLGNEVSKSQDEYRPGPELRVAVAVAAYRARATATDAVVRSLPLRETSRGRDGYDLRWIVLHLIHETARHAGHADATREMLDGTTGE